MLAVILQRMEAHQTKKTAMLRELELARSFGEYSEVPLHNRRSRPVPIPQRQAILKE